MSDEEKLAEIVTTDEEAKVEFGTADDTPEITEEEINRDPRGDIYAAHDKKIQDELDAQGGGAAEKEVSIEDDEAEALASEDDEGPAVEVESDEPETEDDTVTVKIYGEERRVSAEEVEKAGGVDAYQIITANRERLDDTNAQREQLKRDQEALAQERQEWEDSRKTKEQQEIDAEKEKGDNRLKDLYEQRAAARIDEDVEELARLDQQIDDERAEAHQQPNLEEMIDKRVAIRDREADRQAGIRWFDEEHKELAEDPYLREMVNNRVVATEQEYPQEPVSNIIRFHAGKVAEWHESKTVQTRQTSERVEKKRQLSQTKAASGRQKAKAEPKPQTRSEYIAEERARRGLGD